jgi:hypothetical protein
MDFKLQNDTYELAVEDGDIAIAPWAHPRNNELLLVVAPGEVREYPLAGLGIIRYLNEPDEPGLTAQVRTLLQADGYRLDAIQTSGNLILGLQATYIGQNAT